MHDARRRDNIHIRGCIHFLSWEIKECTPRVDGLLGQSINPPIVGVGRVMRQENLGAQMQAAALLPWSWDGGSNPDLLITNQPFFRLNYPGE